MLNRKQNDMPAFGKSPNVRRKIEFPDREYQPSVIDRARLTLFNLTDIWKSKIDANKVNKSCESMVANRKALDVLTVWTRHRRSPSAEPKQSTNAHKRSAFIENGDDEYGRINGKSYIKIVNGKTKSKYCDVSDKGKHRHKRTNKIHDVSTESTFYTRRQSVDAGLNQLNGDENYNLEVRKMRHRRRSWGSLMSDIYDDQCYANKMYDDDRKREKSAENQTSVVRARLKFKKIKTCDDLYANEITKEKPIKVLKRQTSVLPIITINDFDYQPSTVDTKKTKTDEKMAESTHETTKPKKKLSFREPVIFNEKLKELREKQSTTNQSNSQEQDDEKSIANESMDISQVPLESQAMRIVRTIGQAFEVCHKFSLQKNSMVNADDHSESQLSDRYSAEHISDEDEPKKDPIPVTPEPTLKRPTHLDLMSVSNFSPLKKSPNESNDDKSPNAPLSTASEIQHLRDQLEQQALQTREALFQLMQVREQLISETNARIEAQARTQQLLQQNRELLEHLASLGGYTYTENERAGLTSANISLAPQSPVTLFGSEPGECGSPIRKSFVMTPNNNSIATINQQLNNLGTINHQLTQLSQQLSGLNQQSQHLQQFQNMGNNNLNTMLNPVPNIQSIVNSSSFSSNTSNSCNNNTNNAKLTNNFIQSDLFQSNQELLNRLQNLSLGFSNNNSIMSTPNSTLLNHYLNGNVQPAAMNCSTSTSANVNNNNLNVLSSPSSLGNLTPSPVFNRSPCSSSPMLDSNSPLTTLTPTTHSIGGECSNKNVDDSQKFLRPISATPLSDSVLTIFDSVDKFRPATPIPLISSDSTSNTITPSGSSTSIATTVGSGTIRKNDKRVQLPDFTLHITDECGNIMNSKRQPSSATPSTITRTTSEKVPNRSQLMSEVQRTAWARHTTK